MKQKLKRFMAGFLAMLTLVGTLFTNGTTAFAASPQANICLLYTSRKKMQGRQVRRTIRKAKHGMKNTILMVTVIGLIIIQIITINAMTPMRH